MRCSAFRTIRRKKYCICVLSKCLYRCVLSLINMWRFMGAWLCVGRYTTNKQERYRLQNSIRNFSLVLLWIKIYFGTHFLKNTWKGIFAHTLWDSYPDSTTNLEKDSTGMNFKVKILDCPLRWSCRSSHFTKTYHVYKNWTALCWCNTDMLNHPTLRLHTYQHIPHTHTLQKTIEKTIAIHIYQQRLNK